LACRATTGGDGRTPGHPEPEGQEQGDDRTHPHCDALEKTNEKETQSHLEIVRLLRSVGEITTVILTIAGAGLLAT
jgi:hypothetical protein